MWLAPAGFVDMAVVNYESLMYLDDNQGGIPMLKKYMWLCTVCLCLLAVMAGPNVWAHSFTQTELAYMPAMKQLELFKAGVIAPIDVLEAQIARVEQYNGPIKKDTRDVLADYKTWNGKVNAICFERFAEARKAALESGKRWKNGTARALEGITVGIKNENEVKGWRVDQGSLLLKDDAPCTFDGAITEKLKDAGAILAFSTTVPEFYLTFTTWSKLYGITRNPWNGLYNVGGSSGGSGAALAAGFCTLATGSDMAGSIRVPASFNGLYGFKPPFGRVPTSSIQYETLGPMTRTFEDMVLMQNVISGPSQQTISSMRPRLEYPMEYKDLKGAKIAVSHFSKWSGMGNDKDVTAAIDATVKALRKAGATVDVIKFDWKGADAIHTFWDGLMSTSMYELVDMVEEKDLPLLTTYATEILKRKDGFGPRKIIAMEKLQDTYHAEVQRRIFAKGYTALIVPTVMTAEMPADMDIDDTAKPVINGKRMEGDSMQGMLSHIFSLLNTYPVVNVPVALSSNNVPIGVQVVGNTFDDLEAFRVAAQLSKVMPKLYTGKLMPDFRNMK